MKEPIDNHTGESESAAQIDTSQRITNLRLASGAMISFGATMGGRLLQLFSQIIFAKLLGVDDFGRFALGMVIVRLLGAISPLGMGRAAVVFGSRHWQQNSARFKGVVISTLGVASISGLVFGGLGFALAAAGFRPPAFSTVGLSTIALFAVMVPGFSILRVLMDLTLVSQNVKYRSITESLAQPVVALAAFAIFFSLHRGLNSAAAAVSCSYLLSCALGTYFLFSVFRDSLRSEIKPSFEMASLAKFAGPAWVAATFGVCHGLLDRLIVGSFLPAKEMAIYHAASQGALAFLMIVGSFGTIFAPMAAAAYGAGDVASLGRLYRTSTKWGLYLGLPLFVFLQVAAGPILALTFGPDYRAGGTVLAILAVGQIVNVGTGSVGAMLLASGNQYRWMLSTAAGATANAIVGLALVNSWGTQGAAFANLAGNVAMFGSATFFARNKLGIWPYDSSFWKLAAATGMAFFTAFAASMYGSTTLIEVAGLGAAIFLSFALTLCACGVDHEEQQIWGAVRRRLRRNNAVATKAAN
jgi:O-antigen/teichoic acid export membrane protein